MSRSPHVVVGYHHWGLVSGRFAFALARAISYEGNRISSAIELGSPYTDEARNRIVETFLLGEKGDYLLMVDADIEFEKDAISKTMWVAQNFGADVVWGNYSLGTFDNSLFAKDTESEFGVALQDIKPGMVYENIYAGGTGWCLMTRPWLLKMKEHYPGPWHWFGRDEIKDLKGNTIKLGEDISFGRRTFLLGGKQIGYTGIALVHHKLHGTVPQFMEPVMNELGTNVVKSGRAER